MVDMDPAAETARLFKMIEVLAEELGRQGVADVLAINGFDLTALARVAVAANEATNVIPLRRL